MRSLARLATLDAAQRRLLAQALVMQHGIALALRVLGLRRVQGLLAVARTERRGDAAEIARLAAAAARHTLVPPRCLAAALTLQWLLARHGIASRLRLGVRKAGRSIEAHAWIEYAGARRESTDGNGFAPFEAAR